MMKWKTEKEIKEIESKIPKKMGEYRLYTRKIILVLKYWKNYRNSFMIGAIDMKDEDYDYEIHLHPWSWFHSEYRDRGLMLIKTYKIPCS